MSGTLLKVGDNVETFSVDCDRINVPGSIEFRTVDKKLIDLITESYCGCEPIKIKFYMGTNLVTFEEAQVVSILFSAETFENSYLSAHLICRGDKIKFKDVD